ncbi:DUF6892 domain-containing protein [Tenacibaculum aquimarinum]|uniref:DUF6892 domain-containing protein n=1 Tax=Tenacibaculum aquimarinum TaxID=2910675 RepID=UPI001F0A0699|nr:hypothetical protein [Tenacibaculum aquimarinum]MCH3885700.1 hypothetical protein [Tenacibaculum aquimarinum]
MIKLNLSQNEFKINNVSLSFPIEIEILRKTLVHTERVNKKKHNTIYTWDELGILAYSKNGKLIESLSLEFKKEHFDFSAKQIFKGNFLFENEEILTYYKVNKDKRVKLFEGDSSGALVLNNISVWFDSNKNYIEAIEIKAYESSSITEIPKDKYVIKKLDEEQITFVDFGFKLSIIQELMYNKKLIKPKFDLFEFVIWYPKREIDLEEEGYEPIKEVTKYFKDLPIPKRLASEITEIYQDGGNDIYMQLLRFGEGWEDYWDIESAKDAEQFPNLKKAVICYAKENVLKELNDMGIKSSWI